MTVDQILDSILTHEGGYQEDAADRANLGGKAATNYGITAGTLGEWRKLGRPATKAEIKALTRDEARAIYARRFVQPFEWVPFPALQVALVDFGVASGVQTAVRALQKVVDVPVDGVIGPVTRVAVAAMPWKLTLGAVTAARCKHCSDLAEKDGSQRSFLRGWVKRAVSFLV